jgi:hypothetical protein
MRIRIVLAILSGLVGLALIVAGVAATFDDFASSIPGSSAPSRFAQHVATREGGSLAIAGSLCILAAAVLVRPCKDAA